MNRYFKIINDNYILCIGCDKWSGESITEEEYNTILSIIENKPADTETHYYKLRADTLEYEAIKRPEPIEPEADISDYQNALSELGVNTSEEN